MTSLSPDINYLIDQGQFRPIKPDRLIHQNTNWEALHEFEDEFKSIIESAKFQSFIKRKPFMVSKLHVDKVRGTKLVAQIHRNKTSDNLYHFLLDQRLASIDRKDNEWFLFERNVALVYMSLLAKHLARIDENQTTVGTDYNIYEKFN